MNLPYRSPTPQETRRQTLKLGGLNYTQDAREGELADSAGLSPHAFPCLSQRKGRELIRKAEDCQSLFAWGKLVTVEGTSLCYGGEPVGSLTPGKKQMAVVNTKLCVFPDKKYLDLTSRKFGDLGLRLEAAAGSVEFRTDALAFAWAYPCLEKGISFGWNRGSGGWVPTLRAKPYREEDLRWDPATGVWTLPDMTELWKARSGLETVEDGIQLERLAVGDCILLRQSPARGANQPDIPSWYKQGTPYATAWDAWGDYLYITKVTPLNGVEFRFYAERRNVLRANPDLTDLDLRPGDVVTLSGCETFPENDRDVRIAEVRERELIFDAPGLTPGAETGTVTIRRVIPDLDFICESGNRLMGVSNAQRAIYVSALGDPRNFRDYRGKASSSARIGVGTDGDFTGCIAYGGSVLFWKEDCLHRLLGDYAGNFTLYTDQVSGLRAGSEGSMVILDQVLYYHSRDGFYAYAGSVPRRVDRALGAVTYRGAVAGARDGGYTVCAQREDTGTWELLSYDPAAGLWLKEEERQVEDFASLSGTLYMLSEGGLYALDRGDGDQGAPIPWTAEFTPFELEGCEKKTLRRLLLKLELEPGAWAEAELALDKGPFQSVWTSHDSGALSFVLPIRPRRCDRFRVRLKGEGRCLVRSLTREVVLGGVGR